MNQILTTKEVEYTVGNDNKTYIEKPEAPKKEEYISNDNSPTFFVNS